MDLNLISRKNYPLLGRERINLEATFQNSATPKKEDIKKSAASLLKCDENLLAVRHIYTRFGNNKAKVIINLYESIDLLKMFEEKKPKAKKKAKETKE